MSGSGFRFAKESDLCPRMLLARTPLQGRTESAEVQHRILDEKTSAEPYARFRKSGAASRVGLEGAHRVGVPVAPDGDRRRADFPIFGRLEPWGPALSAPCHSLLLLCRLYAHSTFSPEVDWSAWAWRPNSRSYGR